MNLVDLAKKISRFNYVVQRNWENFPHGLLPGHDDIDLLCTEQDKAELAEAVKDFPIKVDIRTPGDLYYPVKLSHSMIRMRVKHPSGFFVPCKRDHFNSLFYHNAIHKKGNPYGKRLRELFLEMFRPIRCTDPGVGHYETDDTTSN